jgi:hypothetical protein
MIWLTIAQGIAHHINANAEELRPRIVDHRGKLKLEVKRDDFIPGSPWNPWPEVFQELSEAIRSHVGREGFDLFVADFSTTGPLERAAYHVTMMDAYQKYFDYGLVCICGIPTITLEGTVSDWQQIVKRVRRLDSLDLEWWTDRLEPVCEQFVRAASGAVDREHWQAIYKPKGAYGGDVATGWIIDLFPYIQDGTVRNQLLEEAEEPDDSTESVSEGQEGNLYLDRLLARGLSLEAFPTGLCSAPLTLTLPDGSFQAKELLGGFTGIVQNPETLALQPVIGWAVRDQDPLDGLIEKLVSSHSTTSPAKTVDHPLPASGFPADLIRFYRRTDGACLFESEGGCSCRVLSLGEICHAYDQRQRARPKSGLRGTHEWLPLADLADGSHLAFDYGLRPDAFGWRYLRYHDDEEQSDSPGRCPIVARSLAELLATLLSSAEPSFPDLGNAAVEESKSLILPGGVGVGPIGSGQLRAVVQLRHDELEEYVGEYRPLGRNANVLTVARSGTWLRIWGSEGDSVGAAVELLAEARDLLYGCASDIGPFQISFGRDERGEVADMTLDLHRAVPYRHVYAKVR